jgi:uncharacterized protein
MSPEVKTNQNDYVIRVLDDLSAVQAAEWDALLNLQSGHATPFMKHAYLQAMAQSLSACADTGWQMQFITLWHRVNDQDPLVLCAACPLYLKNHSYGEYVFDWAWANAYAQHGLDYYPKALSAVPFTPVPGARMLAQDDVTRSRLLQAVIELCKRWGVSSWHLLFASAQDIAACEALNQGLMLRHSVQFHWHNRASPAPYADMADFLQDLSQDKRKKIKQERRKVLEAGVSFRWARGRDISADDWAFFYRCYERTYLEHGNAPYLTPAFFEQMAQPGPQGMAEHWLLFIAEREGRPMACSLIALAYDEQTPHEPLVAYGRYWGALERVDCLHFEACYYQPIEWCIAQGVQRFEGGAQGEHKMARALLPTSTTSAHWLAHPGFAQAVQHFVKREGQGVQNYLNDLHARSPFKEL